MPRPKQFDTEVRTKITGKAHADLQRLAERDARTVSDLVRDAIAAHLKRLKRQEA
jgi:predicted transcriptional regulator